MTRKMQIIKMGIRVIQGANTPPPRRGILPTSASTESAPGTPSALRGKPQRAKSASAAEDENEIKPEDGEYFYLPNNSPNILHNDMSFGTSVCVKYP